MYIYKSDYVEYSYYSNYICIGCIKENVEDLKANNNILNDIPFDGKIIILNTDKKLYFFDVKNLNQNLELKKIQSDILGSIEINTDLGANKKITIDLGKIKVNSFKYKGNLFKNMEYYEILLSDSEYAFLKEKVFELKKESENIETNDSIHNTANLVNEYITRSGYIFKINVGEKKIFYFDIDIKNLVERKNKVYILSSELNKEIEKIILSRIKK